MAIKVFLRDSEETLINSSNIRVGTVFKGNIGGTFRLFRKYNLIVDNFGNRKDYIVSMDEDFRIYWDYDVQVVNYRAVNIEIKEV